MKTRKPFWILGCLMILLSACAEGNFADATDLEGVTWVLTNLSGSNLLRDRRPTLQFKAGQVSGNAGCNHYGGGYQVKGDSIQFEELFNTEMACLDPEGIMDQEQIYLELLRDSDHFELIDGELTIFSVTGRILTFALQQDTSSGPTSTPSPDTAMVEIIVPTLTPTFDTLAGLKEYRDAVVGFAIYLPESWVITSIIPGQSAIFQSYPEGKYVGGESFEAGDTKCDFAIRPEGNRVNDLIDQWQSDSMTTVISEEDITSQSGLTGKRLIIDSMGRATIIVTEINQRVVLLTCFGDFSPVDEIASTMKVLE